MKKIVKLTEDQIKILESYVTDVFNAEVGYRQACRFIREAKEKLWERVHELEGNGEITTDLRWKDKEMIVAVNDEEDIQPLTRDILNQKII